MRNVIRDATHIQALSSPVRLAIVDTLEGVGPCTVATLAGLLGMPPDGLYYHLRMLEKHSLIRRMSEENGAVIDVARRPVILRYDTASAKNRNAVVRLVASMLRGSLRAFRSAFHPPTRVSGDGRELWAAQHIARLTRDDLEVVNSKLQEILKTFAASRSEGRGGRLYELTFVLAPVDPKR